MSRTAANRAPAGTRSLLIAVASSQRDPIHQVADKHDRAARRARSMGHQDGRPGFDQPLTMLKRCSTRSGAGWLGTDAATAHWPPPMSQSIHSGNYLTSAQLNGAFV